jgi:hypothetical protein
MTTPSPLRAWRAHLLLGAWLALVATVAAVRHRSVPELWEVLDTGPPAARLEAAAALSQRAPEAELARRFPAALLESEDPRLPELAFTALFTRRAATAPGEPELARLTGATRERAALWWRLRLTTPGRLTASDLERWFELERAGR